MTKSLLTAAKLIGFALVASVNLETADQGNLKCFADICVNPSTILSKISTFPGAPTAHSVTAFEGTRKFRNSSLIALMEIDCQSRQFRTVKIQQNGKWNTFDPRWTLVPSDNKSYLSKVLDFVCHRSQVGCKGMVQMRVTDLVRSV
jgi:hypothetical protein